MANLSSFSTIHERVRKYKDDYSLEENSDAFEWLALEAILGLNEDEIEDAITDGPMDGGIDAVHITDRDVHVFSFKYAETFEKSTANFPETDLDKLTTTMGGIYGKTLTKAVVNDALWEKVTAIWELFEKGPVNVKYYICSNKEKPVVQAKTRFETALNKYRHVEYLYYDQEDIVSKILEKKSRRVDGEIRFIDDQYFDRSDGPLKGIVATIAAPDLIALVADPADPRKISEDAFNENVRIFLKLKNRINQGIYETALSEGNYEFWYLNNGITIVCDECNYTPHMRTPTVVLKNLQIVNGGQTTHALFEAYLKDSDKLRNVLLLVRICETKNRSISEKISETTNSQNPIRTRDLHANDTIQKQLEEQFLSLGYYYERKKNQHENQPKSKRLNNELLGQLLLAYYLDMPSQAKNQKASVFGDRYEEIFKPDEIMASTMLVPYRVYLPLEQMKKEIQKKKRRKEKIDERDAFISRATFHLVNAVKIIADKESLDLQEGKDIDLAIRKAISWVNEVVVSQLTQLGELYTHDKFFKENNTNKIIREHILGKYPAPPTNDLTPAE